MKLFAESRGGKKCVLCDKDKCSHVWCDWLNKSGVFIVKVTNQVISTYLRWKMWRKEEQNNWTVKQSLLLDEQRNSYNNRFFTDYNETANLPIIKESQI
jgi:hypothetical protein